MTTDDQFFEFCARNSEYRIERAAEGRIVVLPGTSGRTGARSAGLTSQLCIWSEQDGRGASFDSSTLFRLPNTAMRSPDAAWVPLSRLRQLEERQKDQYLPLCPDFVVELTSPNDRLPEVQDKMTEGMSMGCQLGWLLHPAAREVHIYRSSGVEILENPGELTGDGPVAGFRLDLRRIWELGW
ncbi:MAG: Uma2 family endonuclease [Bryobacteraceae bacterium]